MGAAVISLSSRALLLSIYPQIAALQRFYVRLGAVFSLLNAMQNAGVIEVVRSPSHLRQGHVGTHHASDGPAQMPDAGQPTTTAKKQLRSNVELAADYVDNLLKSEPITTQFVGRNKSTIFYFIP